MALRERRVITAAAKGPDPCEFDTRRPRALSLWAAKTRI
jgi:hypothetical protein